MSYRIVYDAHAYADIEEFARYTVNYSAEFASEQFSRLNRALDVLATSPNIWAAFYITGLPYRGYLFRVGRRTSFWIVYTIDEDTKRIKVLRFWNASRDPSQFQAASPDE